jgi:hypothetical protein
MVAAAVARPATSSAPVAPVTGVLVAGGRDTTAWSDPPFLQRCDVPVNVANPRSQILDER